MEIHITTTKPFERVLEHLEAVMKNGGLEDAQLNDFRKTTALLQEVISKKKHEDLRKEFLDRLCARVKRFYLPGARAGDGDRPLTTDRLLRAIEEHDPTGLEAPDLVAALRHMKTPEVLQGEEIVWWLKAA